MKGNWINILMISLLSFITACKGQTEKQRPINTIISQEVVGGPFENGDFMYIGIQEKIASVDTSAVWNQSGQKLLITGTIFKKDGKTPVPGVILYYYHTDLNGLYSTAEGLDPRVARHGYIRGWVKSDNEGKYAIYTQRPAPYPNANEPAHIHPAIKEPDIDKEYYIDEFVFDDDKLLTTAKRRAMENRGGSGVLRLLQKGDLQVAEHNIILGLNIPAYPETDKNKLDSGRKIGEDVFSFTPYHAWGPDKGTKICPICKYGRYHGLLYFVGNNPDWSEIKKWLIYLESESAERDKYLKTYFIYGNDKDYTQSSRERTLEQLGASLGLKHVALTFIPSFSDKESEIYLNKIDQEVRNTFLLYRNSNIIDKFLNLKPNDSNFKLISTRLNETTNEYFNLPSPFGGR